MLDGGDCGDPCGWAAAAIAALSYGSYGVPIKATLDVEVHPLILQSYKTVVLFAMSWFVLFFEESARWTPYGILSGFLWVSGGSFGILGIRNAGMAVAVGTWASVMVLVSFVWGILVFREPVNSFPNACVAFLFLGIGLAGMSKYSSASKEPRHSIASEGVELEPEKAIDSLDSAPDSDGLTSRRRFEDDCEELSPMLEIELEDEVEITHDKKMVHAVIGGRPLSKREVGILCAALNGVLGGSSLIPMHFAKAHGFGGRSYILSFASGSMAANITFWIAYFVYAYFQHRSERASLRTAYEAMPKCHLKELWLRGLIAGVLLTVGMFGSIFSISFLGQGVGNSLVQSKILISGLWGIFWFKEVRDPVAICKWFASAALCVCSILWLSYERNIVVSKP